MIKMNKYKYERVWLQEIMTENNILPQVSGKQKNERQNKIYV